MAQESNRLLEDLKLLRRVCCETNASSRSKFDSIMVKIIWLIISSAHSNIDFNIAFAEKRCTISGNRHESAIPANLTMFSTKKIQAIHDSLVSLSLALIRFKPYAVLD